MKPIQITNNKSGSNYGSTIPLSELEMISISGSNINYPFGRSDKDVIEKAFYNKNGDLLNWSVDYPSDTYTRIDGNYINLNNEKIYYSFNRFDKSFQTIGDKVVLYPARDLKSLGYEFGNFQSVYLPIKNVVGNNNRPLSIIEISNSRKEIKLAYQSNDLKTKSEYIDYVNGTFRTKDVVNDIINGLNSIQLTDYFLSTVEKYPEELDVIKQKYSFNRDSVVMFFVLDLFNGTSHGERKSDGSISLTDSFGIVDQISNLLYTKYEDENTFNSIKSDYSNISKSIISIELKKISNKEPSNEDISFFFDIFNSAFTNILSLVESSYVDKNYGLMKDVLNMGQMDLYNIVNKAAFVDDSTGEITLLVLLKDKLEDIYKIGDKTYISNISPSLPIFNNILLYKQTEYTKKQLRGPNFSIYEINGNSSGTKLISYDDLINKNTTGSLSTLIENYYKYDKKSPIINVDYTNYEKFIKFSSAETRINNFERKLSDINKIDLAISSLSSFTDKETVSEIETLKSRREEIFGSFDGYENYLYDNTGSIDHESAIEYDKYNNDSLENNVPVFIREDSSNSDYIKFVKMIGHMFDNIWVYIDNLPSSQPTTNDGKTGNTSMMLSNILESFGWKVDVNNSSENLAQLLFSKTDFSAEEAETAFTDLISSQDRAKTIWRRMLVNLPFILKSLGTEETIRCILSCYGIPRSLLKIKEYGGVSNGSNPNDKSVWKYDSVYYAVNFTTGSEYISIPWDNGEKSIEFKIRFDPLKTNKTGEVYRFLNCDNRWAVGSVRTRGDVWGKLFFSITNTSETKTIYTDELPIFNGDLYNVLLRQFADKNLVLGQTGSSDLNQYELLAKKVEDSRDVFSVSGSLYLTSSFSPFFQSSSFTSSIKFGNQISSGSNEEFYGNIDQIKTWKKTISNESFDNHATFFDGFDMGTPDETLDNIIFRLNFEGPVNLYSSSGIVSIENSSPIESNLTASFIGFPSPTEREYYDSVSRTDKTTYFPYQFKRFESVQEVKVPNFGGNRYDSEKIRRIDIELFTDLSPTSKAASNINTVSSTDNKNLGIYLSPSDSINEEILKMFTGTDFQNLIGDPSDLYSNKYTLFEEFKRKYQKYINTNVDFTTFFNYVKGYLDKSVFDQIKRSVPANSNLVTGILIEPTILERSKIESKPVEVEIHNNLSTKVEDIQKYQANLPYQERMSVSIPQAEGISVTNNFSGQFIDNAPDKNAYTAFAQNGFATINGENYYIQIIDYPIQRQQDNFNVEPDPSSNVTTFKDVRNKGKLSNQTTIFKKLCAKKYKNISEIVVFGAPLNGYWHYHHKNHLTVPFAKTIRFSSDNVFVKNQQTEKTTVDATGNLNGDLPFSTSVVDRGRPTVTSQGNQNILGSRG